VQLPKYFADHDDLYEWCDRRLLLIFSGLLCNRIIRLSKEHHSASLIQKSWRTSWKLSLRQKDAAVLLQNVFASYFNSRHIANMRKHVECFQSYFYSCITRQIFHKERVSSILFTFMTSMRVQNSFKIFKNSVLDLQSASRSVLLKLRFANLRHIVHLVQTNLHSYLSSASFANSRSKIFDVQAVLLSYLTKRKTQDLISSAEVIQLSLQTVTLNMYIGTLSFSCLSIQSALKAVYCSLLCRKTFDSHHVLQGALQSYEHSRNMKSIKFAVETINTFCNAFFMRSYYNELFNGTTLILESISPYFYSKTFSDLREGVISSQSFFLKYQSVIRFVRFKAATTLIQSALKSTLALRNWNQFKTKVETIQAQLYMCIDCVTINDLKAAALSFRAHASMYICRQAFLNYMKHALVIQASYKAFDESLNFALSKDDILCVQASFGSLSFLMNFRSKIASAETLQSSMSAYDFAVDFAFMKQVTVSIQSAMISLKSTMTHQRNAKAIKDIQGALCSFKSLTRFQQIRSDVQSTSVLRSVLYQKNLKRLKYASTIVQSYFRSAFNQNFLSEYISRKQEASCIIASSFKAYLSNSSFAEYRAIVNNLQAALQTNFVQRKLDCLNSHVDVVQASFRCLQNSDFFIGLSDSTKIIQNVLNAYTAQNYFHLLRNNVENLLTLRSFLSYKNIAQSRNASHVIQAFLRSSLKVQHVAVYLRLKHHATDLISGFLKSYLVSAKISKQVRLVVTSQSLLQTKIICKKFENVKHLSRTVQASFRALQTTSNFVSIQNSAIISQCFLNAVALKHKTLQVLESVDVINTSLKSWRYFEFVKEAIFEERVLDAAASIFVAFYESRKVSISFELYRSAIITCQNGLSSAWNVCSFSRLLNSCKVMQAFISSIKGQLNFKNEKGNLKFERSAVIIQRKWRFFREFILPKRTKSRVLIQSWSRSVLARKSYCNIMDSSLTIQSCFNSFFQLQDRFLDIWSITRAQARVRGYLVRKHCSPEITEARLRIEKAYKNWNSDKSITSRLSNCLQYLLYESQSLSQQVDALKELEYLTSLLPECCTTALEAGAVPALYSFLASLNRSLPHQDIATYSLGILKHLSDHDPQAVLDLNICGKVLMERMTSFREHPQILLRVLKLLDIGCDKVEYFALVKKYFLYLSDD
jgi:hypothetical protein